MSPYLIISFFEVENMGNRHDVYENTSWISVSKSRMARRVDFDLQNPSGMLFDSRCHVSR